MKNTRIYQLITISIPFLFFFFLEAGLRIFDYGRDMPLFIENPSSSAYLLPRPDVVKRYFPAEAEAPSVTIETNFFLKNKPTDGLRIFVQGGSTAAGFPFGYGASIAGMLDYRLKQSFPERPVEVINTALAAVNSYTVLDFVDEIIEQQPDAVLIYAGHNEYLGILGVGSTYTAANSQAATLIYLKLKDLRIFQLLQNIYWQTTQQNIPQNTQASRTFMSKVAKHKNIPFESDLFQQGLEQFEQNISMVIGKYQAAGIPVFLSTIASNLADQKPFSSVKLNIELRKKLQQKYDIRHNTSLSQSALVELVSIATKHQSASLFYLAGQHYQLKEQYAQAINAFKSARDHDLLRFRAPSEMNEIIRQLAKKKAVYLVDSNQALTNKANNGIIGRSLMLEHLHPTVKGYFQIADSFYNTLKKSNIFGIFPNTVSSQNAENDIPVFEAEIYWGKAKIAGLMADYPFTSKPEKPKLPQVKNWSDNLGYSAYKNEASWLSIAVENLKQSKGNNIPLHLKASKLLADAMPFDAQHNYRAGITLIKHKKSGEALRYLKRAIDHDKNNVNSQLALSHAYLELGQLSNAVPWLQSVLKLEPKNIIANDVLPKVKKHLAAPQND